MYAIYAVMSMIEKGDPANGVKSGKAFEALPDDWVCPVCGASKEDFSVQQ